MDYNRSGLVGFSFDNDLGLIMDVQTQDYTAACSVCHAHEGPMLKVPWTNANGHMTGFVFTCEQCCEHVISNPVKIKVEVVDA